MSEVGRRRKPAIETQSLPSLLRCYPHSFTFYLGNPFPIDSCAPAHLKLPRFPARSPLPIAPLPSMSPYPKLHSTCRFAHSCLARRSLGEGGSLAGPAAPFARRYPRDFTFYLAGPVNSIRLDWLFPIW